MSMPSEPRKFLGLLSDGRIAKSASADVRLVSTGVEIKVASDRTARIWPYAQLHSAVPLRGDAPDVLLSLKPAGGETLFVPDPQFTRLLLERAPALSTARHRLYALRPGLAAVALAACITGSMWLLGFDPAKTVARLLPQNTREALGRSVVTSVASNRKVCETADSRAALQRLTQRLTAAASNRPMPVRVVLLDWGLVNAFAAPGGQLILTRGLVQKAGSPDEVAGVLAHELGHALELHPEAGLVRGLGLAAGAQLIFAGSSGTISNIGVILTQLRYTRIAEREADLHALRILKAAGISAKGFGDFFERIEGKPPTEADKNKRFGDFELIRTHPLTAERIAMVRAQPAYPATPAMSDADWKALRGACGSATPAPPPAPKPPTTASAPPSPSRTANPNAGGHSSSSASASTSKPDAAGTAPVPPAPAGPRPSEPGTAPAGIEKPEMAEADRDIADATRTLDTNPGDIAALEMRARAYTRQGKHALALADYTKAVEAKPNDAALHFARGLSLQHLRQFEEAVKAYDGTLRLAPKHIGAYNNRGNSNRVLKRHEAALHDFDEVLRLNPKYVAAFYNRGLVYRDMNRAEDAIRDWTSAIGLDKEYAGAYVQRALLHEKGGARDKAIADFRAALAAPPKYESGQWAHRTARQRLTALGAAQP